MYVCEVPWTEYTFYLTDYMFYLILDESNRQRSHGSLIHLQNPLQLSDALDKDSEDARS